MDQWQWLQQIAAGARLPRIVATIIVALCLRMVFMYLRESQEIRKRSKRTVSAKARLIEYAVAFLFALVVIIASFWAATEIERRYPAPAYKPVSTP